MAPVRRPLRARRRGPERAGLAEHRRRALSTRRAAGAGARPARRSARGRARARGAERAARRRRRAASGSPARPARARRSPPAPSSRAPQNALDDAALRRRARPRARARARLVRRALLRARLRLAQGDAAGALADIDAALALRPGDPALLGVRGSALYRLGRYAEARKDLAAAEKTEYWGWAQPALVPGRAGRAPGRRRRRRHRAARELRGVRARVWCWRGGARAGLHGEGSRGRRRAGAPQPGDEPLPARARLREGGRQGRARRSGCSARSRSSPTTRRRRKRWRGSAASRFTPRVAPAHTAPVNDTSEKLGARTEAPVQRADLRGRRHRDPDPDPHAEVLLGRGAGADRLHRARDRGRARARRDGRPGDRLALRPHEHAARPAPAVHPARRAAVRGRAVLRCSRPPASLAPSQAGAWFGVTFALYFFFHAIYEIPYLGLGAELTRDYNERTSLFGWRTAFLIARHAGRAVCCPAILEPKLGPRGSMSAIGARVRVHAGRAVRAARRGRARDAPRVTAHTPSALVPGVRVAMRNRPFLILFVTFVVASLPAAIPASPAALLHRLRDRPARTRQPRSDCSCSLLRLSAFCSCRSGSASRSARQARRRGSCRSASGSARASGLFFAGKGDVIWVALLHVWAGIVVRRRLPAGAVDAGRRDRLRRAPHRTASRGAVHRVLGDGAEARRDPRRGAADRRARHDRLRAERRIRRPRCCWASACSTRWCPPRFAALAGLLALLYPLNQEVHAAIRAGIDAHTRGEDGDRSADRRARAAAERARRRRRRRAGSSTSSRRASCAVRSRTARRRALRASSLKVGRLPRRSSPSRSSCCLDERQQPRRAARARPPVLAVVGGGLRAHRRRASTRCGSDPRRGSRASRSTPS